jgi:signal transduction histidine kinase
MANSEVGSAVPASGALSSDGVRQEGAADRLAASPQVTEFKFHLAFRDPRLEDAYLEQMYRENRRWVIGMLAVGLVMLFGLSPRDLSSMSTAQLETTHFIRVWVWGPVVAAALAITFVVKTPRSFIALCAVMLMYSGLCLAAIVFIGGSPTIEYVSVFVFQVLLFVYFMSGLPLRWAAVVAIVVYAAQVASMIALQPSRDKIFLWLPTQGIVCFLMGIVAYRFERTSRQNFIAQRQLKAEYSHRLAVERDRIRWLETIAGFLRHELKNAMTGIGSSLTLAERTVVDREGSRYLGRARQSLEFMRRFLRQAVEATSLETALAEQELEPVNLSQLVAGRVRDYREEIADRSFVDEVEQGVWVLGNADRLVQMLDKLVNNAVEHGATAHPIEVGLRTERTLAILSIADIGDALPENLEQIFEPFVSKKPRHKKGNLGLGLYVARVIAARHGGTIRAHRLQNPDGAKLVVELPRGFGGAFET